MVRLEFKKQVNRTSLAVKVVTSDFRERALLKALYNESVLVAGCDIICKDVEFDETDEQNISSMTFGFGLPAPYEGISENHEFENIAQPGQLLLSVLFVNTTENMAQLSMGITEGGSEVFDKQAIAKAVDGNDGLTVVPVNKVFSMSELVSFFLNTSGDGDAWNGAEVDVYFIFRRV